MNGAKWRTSRLKIWFVLSPGGDSSSENLTIERTVQENGLQLSVPGQIEQHGAEPRRSKSNRLGVDLPCVIPADAGI